MIVESFSEFFNTERKDRLYNDLNKLFKIHRNVSLDFHYCNDMSKINVFPKTIDDVCVDSYEGNYKYSYFEFYPVSTDKGESICIDFLNIILPKKTLFFRDRKRFVKLGENTTYIYLVKEVLFNYYQRNVMFNPYFDNTVLFDDFNDRYSSFSPDGPLILLDFFGDEGIKSFKTESQLWGEEVF